jgi:hypothetical protein
MKSPLTTCASGHQQTLMYKAHYPSRRMLIYNSADPLSPLRYYIELHKHNSELCYLGQKKNQAQVAQFAGIMDQKQKQIMSFKSMREWVKQN